jgi:pimeloyl-ACP methyl ester carboxylesterase
LSAAHTPDPATPDTIVLIHGLWLTPLCWEHWIKRYEGRGYRVIAPTWPSMDAPIEDLRRDPPAMAGVALPITDVARPHRKAWARSS